MLRARILRKLGLAVLLLCSSTPIQLYAQELQPDTQIGDFRFKMPSGWRRVDRPDATVLVPLDLPAGKTGFLALLPAQPLQGGLRAWFDAKWAEWQTQYRIAAGGEIKTSRHRNGFDVISTGAQMVDSRGAKVFVIFSAAQSGQAAEAFFFMTDSVDLLSRYQLALLDFDNSLHFANAAGSRASADPGTRRPPPGTPGRTGQPSVKSPTAPVHTGTESSGQGALGVYIGYKMRGLTGLHTHMEQIVFLAGGNVMRYLPEDGLDGFDFNQALRDSTAYCGRYSVERGQIVLMWADGSREIANREGAALRIEKDTYVHVSKCDGLTLEGTYRREGADLAQYFIRFTGDGRFVENGMLNLVAYSGDQRPGRGVYHISNNTLTLSYSDGRSVRRSFYVMPDDARGNPPPTIVVNTYPLLLAR
jgi:hypothetical protein